MTIGAEVFLEKVREFSFQMKGLDDAQKKQKINYILPIIQALSFADFVLKLSGEERGEIGELRSDFAKMYFLAYGQEIKKMNCSDFDPKMMARIESFQKNPDQNKNLLDEIAKYEEKYTHAHSRILFNYGEFANEIFHHLGKQDREKIIDKANGLVRIEEEPELLKLMFEIHEMLGIEKNSGVVEKDDLENHALLNQMSNYSQNILQVLGAFTESEKFEEMLKKLQDKSSKSDDFSQLLKRDRRNYSESLRAMKMKETKEVDVTVGVETEFLLSCKKSDKNDAIKRALADLNARRFMQEKYGLRPTVAAIDDMSVFEVKRDQSENKGLWFDIIAVKRDIKKRINDANWQEISVLIGKEFKEKGELLLFLDARCDHFTPEEAYFYDLLFFDDRAKELKVEIDGVFDPNATSEENFKKAVVFIAKGRFYEKLLDMIRAHEIAFGPFALGEVIDKKNELISHMKLKANEHELSMDEANVQINLAFNFRGQNIFVPKIEEEGGKKVVKTNALAREILLIMEKCLARLGSAREGILRNQEEIVTGLDRKKVISEQLKGTEYFEVDPELSAFLNHKRLAAKNVTLRLSEINEGLAVVEIRLIGNNAHFKTVDDEQKPFNSGIEYIMETILPFLTKEVGKFLNAHTQEQLAAMFAQEVLVNKDGSIEGLESAKVGAIRRVDLYGEGYDEYDQFSELRRRVESSERPQPKPINPQVDGRSKEDSGIAYRNYK